METYEPIDADEASAALASVRDTRARVAWRGFPAWYWLTTGAALAVETGAMLLPLRATLAVSVVLVVLLVMVARAACRARGVCEGWTRSAMSHGETAALYGPAIVVILTSSYTSRFAAWPSAVAAVLVFLLFAGPGLAMSARASCR